MTLEVKDAVELTVLFKWSLSLVKRTWYASITPFCLSSLGLLHARVTDVDDTDSISTSSGGPLGTAEKSKIFHHQRAMAHISLPSE